MTEFASRQIGRLVSWLVSCFLIAWTLTWVVGMIVELFLHGRILNPIWIMELF